MTKIEINNLIERNKQLEHENKVLRDRVIGFVLDENTEITRLNFLLEQSEKINKKLSAELFQAKNVLINRPNRG